MNVHSGSSGTNAVGTMNGSTEAPGAPPPYPSHGEV